MSTTDIIENPLPREIVPGLFWLGQCLHFPYDYKGYDLHAYNSVYVLAGDDRSVIIEGGHPADLPVVEEQLDSLIEGGLPEPEYLFTTHTESPHSGGSGRFMQRFPKLEVVGDISDLHLAFPAYADRLRPLSSGDSIDLGGSELVIVEAVFRDYTYTRWAFDTRRKILFTGDGFAYSHYHQAGQCGQMAEEVPELDLPDMTAQFAELAFAWTRYVDIEPYIDRLDELIFDELGAKIIAPTHGLPITDPAKTMPAIRDGFRIGSATTSR